MSAQATHVPLSVNPYVHIDMLRDILPANHGVLHKFRPQLTEKEKSKFYQKWYPDAKAWKFAYKKKIFCTSFMDDPLCNSEIVLRYEICIPYSQFCSVYWYLGRNVLIFDNPFLKFCLPIIQRPPIETYVMN